MPNPPLPEGIPEDTKTIYWVMYSENVPVESWDSGKVETRKSQHYGTTDLDTAIRTVLEFRDHASKGEHFLSCYDSHPNACLSSAWVEVEHRYQLER